VRRSRREIGTWKGTIMKRLAIISALAVSTAIGAALAARTAVASNPLPMPRPAIAAASQGEIAPGIEARMVVISTIDPAAPHSAGYGVNDSERVVFPIYFSKGWTIPNDESEAAIRAAAEEITYRGLTAITVAPSRAAMLSSDLEIQREAVKRVAAVAGGLERYGVPERWISVQPNEMPGV
tara:strand:- start:1927 stop:2469 length:543 start_codon:yes stop_codon:yes gene_type:complete